MSNLLAGGEPTGISLSAAVYLLCKNPQSLEKLRREMGGVKTRSLSPNITTIKEASECPYLQAVIKETARVFSPIGISITRVVPEGGFTLAGRFFPENVCPCLQAPGHVLPPKKAQHTDLVLDNRRNMPLGSLCQYLNLWPRRGDFPAGTVA